MAYTLNPNVALPYGEGTQFIPNDSNGIVNYSSGYITMDGSAAVAVQVPVGFHPRKIRIVDVTSAAAYLNNATAAEVEYLDFMAAVVAGATILTKTTAGAPAKTLDATGLITIGTDAAGTERTFTIAATALQPSHTYVFEAIA
jgi:hypothetical protein